MKKVIAFISVFFISLTLLIAEANNLMYVKAQEVQLKQKPSVTAKFEKSLYYGEIVEILNEKGKWIEIAVVSDKTISGWVYKSSLTKKKILTTGNKVSADAKELALAGKGFTAEIEKEYKKNGKVDYEAVDKIEEATISNEELTQFITEGKLMEEKE